GFFTLLGIPILAGREFRASDTAGAPHVAIINQTLADRFFAGRNPIGLHFTDSPTGSYEIVGVAKDSKYDDLREKPKPFVYLAAAQDPVPGPMTFYIRSGLAQDALAAQLRAVVTRADAALPVNGPKQVPQQIMESVFLDRLLAVLAAV